ncbi:MAG: phosphoserine phosphatase [Ruminococcaceae bacterium]|nr:phosphoserine phosphatase [Oscillospiraceae bacterium]
MNVYDFDGTIYDGDSTVDFFWYVLKRRPSLARYFPKQFWGFCLYALKRIGKTELKEFFFCFLAAIDGTALAEEFWEHAQERVMAWYREQQQADDVIISASPAFLLEPICKKLGIGCLIASDVDVHTGKFAGENCRGEEKVRRFAAVYPTEGIDRFYSDSDADRPMAQRAKQAFLVKNGRIVPWENDV